MLARKHILPVLVSMNLLDIEKKTLIIKCLTEGNSVRTISRLTGASKTTILKLVSEFGEFDLYRQTKYPVIRPARYKKRRTVPKTFEPQKRKTPWYLDKDSGDPNPEVKKEGIAYADDLAKWDKKPS